MKKEQHFKATQKLVQEVKYGEYITPYPSIHTKEKRTCQRWRDKILSSQHLEYYLQQFYVVLFNPVGPVWLTHLAKCCSTTFLHYIDSNKMIGSIAGLQIVCVFVCYVHVCLSLPSICSRITAYSALRLHQLQWLTVGEGFQTNIDTEHAETQGEWLIEWNLGLVFEQQLRLSAFQIDKKNPNTKLQG